MMNLNENLKPIGDYIKNRDQMFSEMLRCIKGVKLQAMLPGCLKDKPFSWIKQKCMEELEVMSKKRIRFLLMGKEMTSSSGTDESDSDDAGSDILGGSFNEKKKDAIEVKEDFIEDLNKSKSDTVVPLVSKFKPMGSSNVVKEEKKVSWQNRIVLDNDRYQENETRIENEIENSQENLNINEITQQTPTATSAAAVESQQTQGSFSQSGGIAAAGFKKFIKKSISIRIKNVDTFKSDMKENLLDADKKGVVVDYEATGKDSVDDYYGNSIDDARNQLNSLLEGNSYNHRTNNYFNNNYQPNQPYRYTSYNDLMYNSRGGVPVRGDVRQRMPHEFNENNVENDLPMASYDYSYDIDEDLSKLESEIEHNISTKKGGSVRKSGGDLIDSGKHKKDKLTKVASNGAQIDEIHGSKKRSKHQEQSKIKEKKINKSKHKQQKSSKKERVAPVEDDNESLEYSKQMLVDLLESHIAATDDDEIKEMLVGLLNGINESEELSVDECMEFYQMINQIYSNSNSEETKVQTAKKKDKNRKKSVDPSDDDLEEDEDEEDVDDDWVSVDEDDDDDENISNSDDEEITKSRKRKRKSKGNSSSESLRKRNKTKSKKHSKHNLHNDNEEGEISNDEEEAAVVCKSTGKHGKHRKSRQAQNNDYYDGRLSNEDVEEMEAGEIDDMYDDELSVEKELKNLLDTDSYY